jgi:hypothetical protein
MNLHTKSERSAARSYWLSASNYYVLSVAIAMAAFVTVMGLLREERDEPYIPAGIAASAVLIAAVVIRRSIIKKYQMRAHAARRLDQNLSILLLKNAPNEKKLTIEKNASILKELKRKSEAATVLGQYSEGHREVYEFCGQYLEVNAREMLTVNPGSPRIAALRRGREIAEDYHRRHMLKWAELETTALFEKAQVAPKLRDRIETAGEALSVIKTASGRYPTDRRLIDSAVAIDEFIIKTKVSDLIEKAGRAEGRGNHKLAERHFRNALSELGRSRVSAIDRETAAEKIRQELERLSHKESD